eukprot:CAMPEP_0202979990 /NCGR_PEP_ID=MMETSP1396-20130829/85991_1 /ASSEMBLY_ACC=CAM_ASM_000872 /TAXON_ID= /ORGANISM="Pseudokeronopsis sp., Strain Brazil" /LENGTH=59 /DNA_ID=CAMNT_0049719669 /DNA_START=978 /DNA_END=1157 /DNA_ORIENTATION=+
MKGFFNQVLPTCAPPASLPRSNRGRLSRPAKLAAPNPRPPSGPTSNKSAKSTRYMVEEG